MSQPKHDAPSVPLELLFEILRDDWARARLYCDEARLLLSDDPRLEHLKKIGGDFANEDVPALYIRDMVLRITKLTDPAKTGPWRNASLEQLLAYYEDDSATYATLGTRIDDAKTASQFARDWRNKHIAHRAYEHATNLSVSPLPPIDFGQIDEALTAIHAVLQVIRPEVANAVVYPPRIDALVGRLIQMAKVITYISDRIGPPDHHPIPDQERLRTFLKEIGGDPADIYVLYQLREAARWFQNMAI